MSVSLEQYKDLFEACPYGIIVYDTEYNVLDCNDALASVLHSTRDLVVGLNFKRIPDQRILPAITESLTGATAKYRGTYVSATSGAEVITVFTCMPLRDAEGEVVGGFGIAEDATERIKREEALREQLALTQRQAETIRELGSPILKLWDEVLCLPVIGEVDDARATKMTEAAVSGVIREEARFLVLDLTSVPALDDAAAQNLSSLFKAVALVGAEVVVCGVQPRVAQGMVSFEVGLASSVRQRTLRDALEYCLGRLRLAL